MAGLAHPLTVIWLACAEAVLAGLGSRTLGIEHVPAGALTDILAYALYAAAAALGPHSVGWRVLSFAACLPIAHALVGIPPVARLALGVGAQRRVLLDAWLAGCLGFGLALLVVTSDVGEKVFTM
ncbi:hypothetical protein T492DRAFT_879880 [Pavlovales sp. CCMP2436]|nr:hypothetical protein T492DRAFT_879880 [Pavlovales sp. CCMP2436]